MHHPSNDANFGLPTEPQTFGLLVCGRGHGNAHRHYDTLVRYYGDLIGMIVGLPRCLEQGDDLAKARDDHSEI